MFDIEFRLGKEERVIPVKNYKKEVFYAFCKERDRIQAGIAALVNYEKDFTDNHKYNYLREQLWRKEHPKDVPISKDLAWKFNEKQRYNKYYLFCKERGLKLPNREMFFNHDNERKRQEAREAIEGI